jgi:branched-chain amino acid transport system substrate-binding protein
MSWPYDFDKKYSRDSRFLLESANNTVKNSNLNILPRRIVLMQKILKKSILAAAAASLIVSTAQADTKVGIILGFTGPLESLTPSMAHGAEMAFKEVSDSGKLMNGEAILPVRADSTCIDSSAATTAAERLVNSDNVVAIMGADCSGVTGAIAKNVGAVNGVAMISPSATSPGLSTIDDNGIFFRTAPSDDRQGQLLAQIVKARGIDTLAVTYTNNDYGKALAESFTNAFEKLDGQVSISAAHEDGKADYSAEVGALSASGAKELAVFGYVDQGGRGIIQSALDTDAFDRFILADGMISNSLLTVDGDLSGSFGTGPGSQSSGAEIFNTLASDVGLDGTGMFVAHSYDAAALIALAIQAGGSDDRASIVSNIMNVANAPGTVILPGELANGLEILANGGSVNYEGATSIEFDANGDTSGSYKELEIGSGKFNIIKYH